MCPVGVVVCTGAAVWSGAGSGPPAGGLFGVVAGGTQPLPVGGAGWSAGVVGDDVVDVADRGVAPGGAAGAEVAGDQEAAQVAGEEPSAGVHRDQLAGAGVGVEPTQPDSRHLAGLRAAPAGRACRDPVAVVGIGEPFADQAGGDGAVAGKVGGFVVAGEQGTVGDHDLQLDAGGVCGALTGEAFDEGVGHDLAAAAGVALGAGGVGGLEQGGVGGHPVLDREQRREVDHGVGCGPDGDPPVRGSFAGPAHDRGGVEAAGQLLHLGLHRLVAHAVEAGRVGGQQPVHGGPVLPGQARGAAHDEGGPPLRDPAVEHAGQGVRHLAHQGVSQVQVLLPAVRGLPPRQPDLGGDALALQRRRESAGGALGPGRGVQVGGGDRLHGRRGRLQLLQRPEPVDPLGVVHGPVQARQVGDPAGDRGGVQHPTSGRCGAT